MALMTPIKDAPAGAFFDSWITIGADISMLFFKRLAFSKGRSP
jgi:hypothetical protein